MNRRSAVTLIEVLVSIFIMGVGLLALLTLFPLGALTMDQAIRADRAGAAARNAYGIVAAKNIRRDSDFYNPNKTPVVDAFTDPNPPGLRTTWPIIPRQPGAYAGVTYPIYVDPWGVLGNAGAVPLGAASAVGSPGIPRRTVSFVNGVQQALKWFSLLDDLEFDDNGLAKASGGAIQRSNRYTWALLLRRVRAPEREWTEMAVIVYHGRPLEVPVTEPAYAPVTFDTNSNSVFLEWNPATQERPAIRKGGWVLDATVLDAAGQPAPHGYFYRVVGVADAPARTAGMLAMEVELQDRPRKGTTRGVLVVMENVTEVFDEGLGWKP